jgi:hypothetical protein
MIVVHGFDYNFDSKIQQAVKSGNSIINGIDYSECLENNSINTTKISEIDPEGKIFKLNGYFTDPEETIRVIGNTIYITRKGDPNNANAINNK